RYTEGTTEGSLSWDCAFRLSPCVSVYRPGRIFWPNRSDGARYHGHMDTCQAHRCARKTARPRALLYSSCLLNLCAPLDLSAHAPIRLGVRRRLFRCAGAAEKDYTTFVDIRHWASSSLRCSGRALSSSSDHIFAVF